MSKTSDQTPARGHHDKGERIAKVLARAGVGSRREVERMIAAGRITLDGKPVDTPATLVKGTRGILIDGRPAPAVEPTRLWRYHKPRGLVTTVHDPQGRATVFSALPGSMPRVVSIGRLDINTEGLLLLTNDGELARWIELPKTGWIRRYRVRVHGTPDQKKLEALKSGITVDGVHYGPIEARLERVQGQNAWLEISLREGKNREVKRVMEHLGLQVTRLIRTAFGPYELGNLNNGAVAEVSGEALQAALPAELRKKTGAANGKPAKRTGFARKKPKSLPKRTRQ